jgi:hypothetical protein
MIRQAQVATSVHEWTAILHTLIFALHADPALLFCGINLKAVCVAAPRATTCLLLVLPVQPNLSNKGQVDAPFSAPVADAGPAVLEGCQLLKGEDMHVDVGGIAVPVA